MTIARCPRCLDEIRIPSGVPSDSLVRCPLCRETYAFAEMEQRLPPLLEIFTPAPAIDSTAELGFAAAEASAAEPPVSLDSSDPWDYEAPRRQRTALGDTALGDTALGDTALGNTALGNTALGDVPSETPFESPAAAVALDESDAEVALDDEHPLEEFPLEDDTENLEEFAAVALDDAADEPFQELSLDDEPGYAGETLQESLQESFVEHARPASEEGVTAAAFLSPEPSPFEAAEARGPSPARLKSSRKRRKEKNMVWEMTKIVLGGLLAAPAAQLILLWMPGNWKLEQRDPVGAANYLARFTPFLVPSQIRAQLSDTGGGGAMAADFPSTGPAANIKAGAPEPELPSFNIGGETKLPDFNLAANGDSPTTEPEASSAPETSTLPAPSLEPGTTEPADSSPLEKGLAALDSAPPSEKEKMPAATSVGTEPPAPGPAADSPAGQAFAQAQEANASWDAAPTPGKEEKRQLYTTFAKLGEVLIAAGGDAALGEPMAALLTAASSDPAKQAVLGGAAGGWIDSPSRKSDGIVFVATVRDTQVGDNWFELTVELATADKRQVTVVAKADQANELVIGEPILAVGTIVKNPLESLPGYTGSAETVLRLALSVPCPKE